LRIGIEEVVSKALGVVARAPPLFPNLTLNTEASRVIKKACQPQTVQSEDDRINKEDLTLLRKQKTCRKR
jgi:hypothetical protein